MALSREVMGGGFSAGQSHAINGQLNASATAAGTTQATAFVIRTSMTVFTTVAANSGAIIPNMSHRDSVLIYNKGANPLTIYPPVSGQIYPAATNVGITLTNPGNITITKVGDTLYIGNLSA